MAALPSIHRCRRGAWMIVAGAVSLACSQAITAIPPPPPAELFSPDKNYSVKIIDGMAPGAVPDEPRTLVLSAKGTVISRLPTFGFLSGAFWNPDARYVAVNNRRANAGDYVWIISLSDGRALKYPEDLARKLAKPGLGSARGDDEKLTLRQVQSQFPECIPSHLRKGWLYAEGWQNLTDLVVVESLAYNQVKDAIDVRKIYRVAKTHVVLVEQTVSKYANKDADVSDSSQPPSKSPSPPSAVPAKTTTISASSQASARATADQAIAAMRERDWMRLAQLIHPALGVRVSPSSHVDLKADRVFRAQEIATMEAKPIASVQRYKWGYSERDDEKPLSLAQYMRTVVWNRDYSKADKVSVNKDGKYPGGSISNAATAYPNGTRVEYYAAPTAADSLDWGVLRLVLETLDGKPYVVGVISDRWGP